MCDNPLTPNIQMLKQQVILNTRPAHQQATLNRLLASQGATILSFPGIEIVDSEATAFHLSLIQPIQHYHIALFVSRNAVERAFRFLQADQLPPDLQLGVIGEGSYHALARQIINLDQFLIHHPDSNSETFNSESLLAAPNLQQVEAKNVLIFRGQQGRNLLGDELQKRGATVSYCEVYRRQLPNYDIDHYQCLCQNYTPTIAIFTSTEGMQNTMRAVDSQSQVNLLQTPWLLISERMRESAINLGHNATIIIAKNANDKGIQQAISEWTSEQTV